MAEYRQTLAAYTADWLENRVGGLRVTESLRLRLSVGQWRRAIAGLRLLDAKEKEESKCSKD